MKKVVMLLMVSLIGLTLIGCQKESSEKESDEKKKTETNTDEKDEGKDEDSSSAVSVNSVSTGDNEMDYIKFGNGEKNFVIIPGISVHSVMGSADAIADAYKVFTDEYTVYVFDRPKKLEEGYTIRRLAEDTAAAMKELKLEDADVFGASQGGMMAMYLAIDHPELVHKLILGSTLAKPNDTFNQVAAKWLSLAENRDEQGLLESFADDVYSEATLKTYRDTLISANKGISEEEYQRFIILGKSCQNFNCYDELSSIQCPVLVLGSEGDKVVTAEGSRQIAEALGCEIYLYDASYGHGVYDEAPDYKQRCLDFLAE